jgi:hypothetical protein
MSADAWRVCPECFRKWEAENELYHAQVEEAYGQVPAEQYIKMLAEDERRQNAEPEETMREDYFIWMNEDGVFEVNYRALCTSCNFHFEYNYTQAVVLTA